MTDAFLQKHVRLTLDTLTAQGCCCIIQCLMGLGQLDRHLKADHYNECRIRVQWPYSQQTFPGEIPELNLPDKKHHESHQQQ